MDEVVEAAQGAGRVEDAEDGVGDLGADAVARGDGDGDGVENPQDVDDAAMAAARYLCASGDDLATATGWSAAVFSYNHSNDYVTAVYDAAKAYADRTS